MSRRLLWAASAALFLAALDAYAVVTLLPAMLSSLGLSVDRLEQAAPMLSGFLGGYVVAMPLVGAASDARGRGPLFVLCCLVFFIGSAVTALAPSNLLLVGGRVLQGLGGGGLVPVAMALAADLFGGRGSRVAALGAVAALQEAGSVFGPLWGTWVAGLFHDWRPVFLVSGLLVLLAGVLGVWAPSRRLAPDSPAERGRGHFDVAGGVLMGGGLAAGVVALYPDDPSVRAVNAWFWPLAGLCVILLGLFGWRSSRVASPLLPSGLTGRPGFWLALAANLFMGAALMVALVDVPVLARGVYGIDQNAAGLLLTRFLAGIPVGAVLGGLISARLGRRTPVVLGFLGAAAMFAAMSGWGAHQDRTDPVGVFATLFTGGLGFGLVIAPLSALVLELGGSSEHGVAAASFVVARTLGMLAGLSGLTAFGLRRFYVILGSLGPCSGTTLSAQLSCLEGHVRNALLREYQEIFLVAAGLCLLALLLAVLSLSPRTALRAGPG